MLRLPIIILFLSFLGIAGSPGFGQENEENEFVVSLFNNLYSLRFHDAKKNLDRIKTENIDHDMMDICIANYHWWHIVTLEEYSSHKITMNAALDRIIARHQEALTELKDPDVVFAIGHAYAYKTRLDMHEGNYLKGVRNLNMAGKYLELILPRADEDIKYKLLSGLYHYIAGSILDRYPVFRPLFVFAPDICTEKGLRYLEECSRNPHPLISIEASYFIMRVNTQVTQDNVKADRIVSKLQQQFPDNIYFSSYRICILADSGNKAGAIREYNKLRRKGRPDQVSQVQYSFIMEETEKHLRKKRIKFQA